MLRWILLLRAYNYKLKYRAAAEIANADALSRLPLPTKETEIPPNYEVLMLESMAEPILGAKEVAELTRKDAVLSTVLNYCMNTWPQEKLKNELEPYGVRKGELSVYKNCVLWGSRVIIPPRGRERVLKELHNGHQGIVKMKSMARSYVWWPGIDRDLERAVQQCQICQQNRSAPPKVAVQPWENTKEPWVRVHIDFAGPFHGQYFLIVVDSYSKWLEVRRVPSTSAAATIKVLWELFATHGLPDLIVTDNGTAFTSEEFQIFLRKNLIRHARTAPYKPSTNGQAERMVRSTKEKLSQLVEGDWEIKLARFLLVQHTSVSATTGFTPAELLMNRKLRTYLDRVHPDRIASKSPIPREEPSRILCPTQEVYARNYGVGSKWIPGIVTTATGPVSYQVETMEGQVLKRHVDQIITRKDTVDSTGETLKQDSVEGQGRNGQISGNNAEGKIENPTQKRPTRVRKTPKYFSDYVTD